ncbi:MAG: hypothetical protein R2795_07340 [Saprospiraceae bacterium]
MLVQNRVAFDAVHVFNLKRMEEEIIPKYPHLRREIMDSRTIYVIPLKNGYGANCPYHGIWRDSHAMGARLTIFQYFCRRNAQGHQICKQSVSVSEQQLNYANMLK